MADLAAVFTRVGGAGHLHAVPVRGPGEVALAADEPVHPASVFKVLVALEVERQLATGALRADQPLRLDDAVRTDGPVGLSLFAHPASLAVADAVVLMLTISDNVTTDALLRLVGLPAVAERAAALGLTATRVETDLRTLVDTRDVRPDGPLTTTARDLTTLLRAIWTDDPAAAPPAGCARVRWLIQRQLTRDRLAPAFPEAEVAAKSGAFLGHWRNEAGVVTTPDGSAYAVAVLVRALEPPLDRYAVDAAIGEAARLAVAELGGLGGLGGLA